MNGNYEFVKQMAKDRQTAYLDEARNHRMAKQAGSQGGARSTGTLTARVGAWLHWTTYEAVDRAAGQLAYWKASLGWPGTAAR